MYKRIKITAPEIKEGDQFSIASEMYVVEHIHRDLRGDAVIQVRRLTHVRKKDRPIKMTLPKNLYVRIHRWQS